MTAPRKYWGQHFLKDKNIINDILVAVAPKASDTILEIGPGRGALTQCLLDSGARVIAIEIDTDLSDRLGRRFANNPNLQLINADALHFSYDSLEIKPGMAWRAVANLPYNIGIPLVFKLLNLKKPLVDMHLMLQREVAQRICATTGGKAYGRLSLNVQSLCRSTLAMFDIAPIAFSPPPKVHSTFIQLISGNNPLDAKQQLWFEYLVRTAFNGRRKTLGNTLKSCLNPELWEALAINPKQRPQQTTPQQYQQMARRLATTGSPP